MPQPIQGIHHLTSFASDPQQNVDFYTQVLGQRLVKTTVNFDDPGLYHLYYGDNIGSPGTIMTFFPLPRARRGTPGNGEVTAIAYAIHPDSVAYWQARFAELGVSTFAAETRFGVTVLPFADPDGMRLELVTDADAELLPHWENGPIPHAHALRGFHGVTIWTGNATGSARLLTDSFGMTEVASEGSRTRYAAAGGIGTFVDLVERPGMPRGRNGAGIVHHIAWRTRDDAEQVEWQQQLAGEGYGVTQVLDRQYFHSIYFREPSGVLFEIATDPPGFLHDEPIETLGQTLKLPSWLESRRNLIEQMLPTIALKEGVTNE